MTGAERLAAAQRHELAVAHRIRALGHSVEPFGQALLRPAVRDYITDTNSLLRWLPDLAVMVAAARVLVLVDAKGCLSTNTANHALEMRSLAGARLTELPVWYVCHEFRALSAASVLDDGPDRMCCSECWDTFTHHPDVLPTRCPRHRARQGRGSGTPYVLVRKDRCIPLERALPPTQQNDELAELRQLLDRKETAS